MTKVYTRVGDKGNTLINNKLVRKDACQVETLGCMDSLMASLDRAIYGLDILPEMEEHYGNFEYIQDILRATAGTIAGKENSVLIHDVEWLEELIDEIELDVYEFVRFSNPIAMDIDEARVRTRKLERELAQYMEEKVISNNAYAFINRLSDYFFVLAVYIDKKFK